MSSKCKYCGGHKVFMCNKDGFGYYSCSLGIRCLYMRRKPVDYYKIRYQFDSDSQRKIIDALWESDNMEGSGKVELHIGAGEVSSDG